MILAGLIGAIVWDLITWYYGLPTSSSHALIGGYAGAAVAKAGAGAHPRVGLDQDAGLHRARAAHRPGARLRLHDGDLLGLSATPRRRASTAGSGASSSCRRHSTASVTAPTTRRRRWASSPARCSPAASSPEFYIPFWVVLIAHAAIALGTLSGGWRIIHTMGSKITRLQPVGGFAAETAGAVSLFTATALGVPVSTTHTITGAIVGVGATRRLSAVRWGVARRIVWAWVLTIPASAVIAAACVLPARGRRLLNSTSRPWPGAEAGDGQPHLEARAATGAFCAATLPPCRSARCLTMARPRPVPPGRPRDLSTR